MNDLAKLSSVLKHQRKSPKLPLRSDASGPAILPQIDRSDRDRVGAASVLGLLLLAAIVGVLLVLALIYVRGDR